MTENNRVSLKDVYDINNRIEDKLDNLESRISTLEIWRAEIMGKAAIFIAIVNVAVLFAIDFIRSKVK